MSIDPKTNPSVTFNVAIHDYVEWVAKQPFIRKRFYTFEKGVPTLMSLIIKHFGGNMLGHHTCSFKYRGIDFVVESKNAYVYSICENY